MKILQVRKTKRSFVKKGAMNKWMEEAFEKQAGKKFRKWSLGLRGARGRCGGGWRVSLSETSRWERVRVGDGMKKIEMSISAPSLQHTGEHGSARLVPVALTGGWPRPADKPRCCTPPITLLITARLLAALNGLDKPILPQCCFRTGRG